MLESLACCSPKEKLITGRYLRSGAVVAAGALSDSGCGAQPVKSKTRLTDKAKINGIWRLII